MNSKHLLRLIGVMTTLLAFGLTADLAQEPAKRKYKVSIQDEKAVVVNMDDSGQLDPVQRIRFNSQGAGFFANITTVQNQILHLSHFPQFQINGRVMQAGQGGRFEGINQPLPKGQNGKPRTGSSTTWVIDNLRITQTMELHPTKPKGPGQKRLLNTVLITYALENKGASPQNVGVRGCMDTYVINNDGCLFAAPTMPDQLLDGIVLKDKTLPPYVQMLQINDIKDKTGYRSHLTLNIGGKYEKINKVILSSLQVGFGQWEMPVAKAGMDSAISFYWETKEIKPGAKRELAYAYGEGVAVPFDSEGRFQIALGGSFEPGKMFTISAVVADPILGQTMALELPAGIERLEGKEVQPVAALAEEQQYGTALWKARVTEPGKYPIRVRSSNGMTQSKIVTIVEEK